jgi:hypothetical protein
MSDTIECTTCSQVIDRLDRFPGGDCVKCYADVFDAQPMPTGEEISGMFRNSITL